MIDLGVNGEKKKSLWKTSHVRRDSSPRVQVIYNCPVTPYELMADPNQLLY